MNLRFLSVFFALLVGVTSYAQSGPASTSAPKIAILELELGKGVNNNAFARDDFKRLVSEELLVSPISGERPSNLIALFSCAELDVACLKQISLSLKVRFVLYGSLEVVGTSEKFSGSLFDAEKEQLLTTQTVTFLFDNRSDEMKKAIQKIVRVQGTEAIRSPEKIEPKKKESKGLWKFVVPVVFVPGIAIFGLQARETRAAAADNIDVMLDPADGPETVSKGENKAVFKKALASDVFIVATIGSATWALLSHKKHHKKPSEQAASNP